MKAGVVPLSFLVCFHNVTFFCQKSVGKNTSLGSYVTTPAAPRLRPKKLHTIPYNKIIRNCMELSGILTVQALCVFSCCLSHSQRLITLHSQRHKQFKVQKGQIPVLLVPLSNLSFHKMQRFHVPGTTCFEFQLFLHKQISG